MSISCITSAGDEATMIGIIATPTLARATTETVVIAMSRADLSLAHPPCGLSTYPGAQMQVLLESTRCWEPSQAVQVVEAD